LRQVDGHGARGREAKAHEFLLQRFELVRMNVGGPELSAWSYPLGEQGRLLTAPGAGVEDALARPGSHGKSNELRALLTNAPSA
jgi:hypothetical protein